MGLKEFFFGTPKPPPEPRKVEPVNEKPDTCSTCKWWRLHRQKGEEIMHGWYWGGEAIGACFYMPKTVDKHDWETCSQYQPKETTRA